MDNSPDSFTKSKLKLKRALLAAMALGTASLSMTYYDAAFNPSPTGETAGDIIDRRAEISLLIDY